MIQTVENSLIIFNEHTLNYQIEQGISSIRIYNSSYITLSLRFDITSIDITNCTGMRIDGNSSRIKIKDVTVKESFIIRITPPVTILNLLKCDHFPNINARNLSIKFCNGISITNPLPSVRVLIVANNLLSQINLRYFPNLLRLGINHLSDVQIDEDYRNMNLRVCINRDCKTLREWFQYYSSLLPPPSSLDRLRTFTVGEGLHNMDRCAICMDPFVAGNIFVKCVGTSTRIDTGIHALHVSCATPLFNLAGSELPKCPICNQQDKWATIDNRFGRKVSRKRASRKRAKMVRRKSIKARRSRKSIRSRKQKIYTNK